MGELADLLENDPVPSIEDINALEQSILTLPQVDMPTKSEFLNGLYIRTMHIPKGTILTGAVHKEDHVFFVREGHLLVWTAGHRHYFYGGDMIFSKAGIKKVGYAIEECIVTTVHPNPENISDEKMLWNKFTYSDMPLRLEQKGTEAIK